MNCTSCGANLSPGVAICPLCGTPAPYNANPAASSPQYDPTVVSPTATLQPTTDTTGTANAQVNATATGAAQTAVNATATAQANATATAIAQANTNVTATVSANQTVTAQANNPAMAAAIARQNEYTGDTSGTPILNDPLSDNSKGYGWNVGSGECQFTGGALHAIRTSAGSINCDATGASSFSNFAFQVQMMIISGEAGGIDFRSNSGSGYFFSIGQDGSYTFYRNANFSLQTIANGSSAAIHTGLGQTNVITVIAKNNMFDLYVNGQYVTTVTDSTNSQGFVGVDATDINNSTEVAFSNAKVWTL